MMSAERSINPPRSRRTAAQTPETSPKREPVPATGRIHGREKPRRHAGGHQLQLRRQRRPAKRGPGKYRSGEGASNREDVRPLDVEINSVEVALHGSADARDVFEEVTSGSHWPGLQS